MAGAKSAGYKLATYKSSEGPRAGIIVGNDVFDAAKLTGKAGYATVMGILADWKAAEPALKKAAAGAAKSRAKRQPLSKTKLLAPLRFPSAIYCAGANYGDHAAEMAAKRGQSAAADPHTLGLKAWHFLKAAGAITDPGATVKISDYAKNMDWEIELAAVIGKTAKGHPAGQGAVLRRRLHDRQRSVGARSRPPGRCPRRLAVQVGLDQAQDLRRLLPARAVDRAGERHRRPAKARPETVGQRRAQAGFQHRAT